MTETDLYPVWQIATDAKEAIEQLGSKPKFWLRFKDVPDERWLFKFARENTGEDWSEKIAADVAVLLDIEAARVELAEFADRRGIISLSFTDSRKGVDLIHGNELLAGRVTGYDKTKLRQQRDHAVPNILRVIEETFKDEKDRKKESQKMAGLVILDAVIGNTDRHHENWGMLRRAFPDGVTDYHVSPSFDHASSLGRELADDKRAARLKEKTVLNYLRKGRGGVYWSEQETRAPSPLDLAIKAAERYPDYFSPWVIKLRALDTSGFARIISKIPPERMSIVAKEFAGKMMETAVEMLRGLNL
jgi:hypothetical protein